MALTEHDLFIDYCTENGLDPDTEDFYAWRDEQRERAQDAAEQRDLDFARGK